MYTHCTLTNLLNSERGLLIVLHNVIYKWKLYIIILTKLLFFNKTLCGMFVFLNQWSISTMKYIWSY